MIKSLLSKALLGYFCLSALAACGPTAPPTTALWSVEERQSIKANLSDLATAISDKPASFSTDIADTVSRGTEAISTDINEIKQNSSAAFSKTALTEKACSQSWLTEICPTDFALCERLCKPPR